MAHIKITLISEILLELFLKWELMRTSNDITQPKKYKKDKKNYWRIALNCHHVCE